MHLDRIIEVTSFCVATVHITEVQHNGNAVSNSLFTVSVHPNEPASFSDEKACIQIFIPVANTTRSNRQK